MTSTVIMTTKILKVRINYTIKIHKVKNQQIKAYWWSNSQHESKVMWSDPQGYQWVKSYWQWKFSKQEYVIWSNLKD